MWIQRATDEFGQVTATSAPGKERAWKVFKKEKETENFTHRQFHSDLHLFPYQTEGGDADDTFWMISWVTVLHRGQTHGSAGASYPQQHNPLFTFGAYVGNCLNFPRFRSHNKIIQNGSLL